MAKGKARQGNPLPPGGGAFARGLLAYFVRPKINQAAAMLPRARRGVRRWKKQDFFKGLD